MIAVITAVTQQQSILLVTPTTHEAEVQVNLCHYAIEIRGIGTCCGLRSIRKIEWGLTKLTSRVSLRGLILMAKAWALS